MEAGLLLLDIVSTYWLLLWSIKNDSTDAKHRTTGFFAFKLGKTKITQKDT